MNIPIEEIPFKGGTMRFFRFGKGIRNLVIRPGRALGIRRTENDPKELERVYQMGRQTGIDQLEAVRRFLT